MTAENETSEDTIINLSPWEAAQAVRGMRDAIQDITDAAVELHRKQALELKEMRYMIAAILLTTGPVRVNEMTLLALNDKVCVMRSDGIDSSITFSAHREP